MKEYTISDFAKASGLTRQYIWTLIQMRRIKARRVGFIWLVPESELQRMIDKRREGK